MCDFDSLTPICSPCPSGNQISQWAWSICVLHSMFLGDRSPHYQCGLPTKDRGSGPPAVDPVCTVSLPELKVHPESTLYPQIPQMRALRDAGEDRTICSRSYRCQAKAIWKIITNMTLVTEGRPSHTNDATSESEVLLWDALLHLPKTCSLCVYLAPPSACLPI